MSFARKIERDQAILEDYQRGCTMTAIALALGITKQRVSQIIRAAGVSRGQANRPRGVLGWVWNETEQRYGPPARLLDGRSFVRQNGFGEWRKW